MYSYDPELEYMTKSNNLSYSEIEELQQIKKYIYNNLDESKFMNTVLEIMKEHGITKKSEVYNSAYMSRQDFSRITNPDTEVTRNMIWKLCIGLKCNLDEVDRLLSSAGYIRKQSKRDLVLEYFIIKGNHNIIEINDVLYELGLEMFSIHVESINDFVK